MHILCTIYSVVSPTLPLLNIESIVQNLGILISGNPGMGQVDQWANKLRFFCCNKSAVRWGVPKLGTQNCDGCDQHGSCQNTQRCKKRKNQQLRPFFSKELAQKIRHILGIFRHIYAYQGIFLRRQPKNQHSWWKNSSSALLMLLAFCISVSHTSFNHEIFNQTN